MTLDEIKDLLTRLQHTNLAKEDEMKRAKVELEGKSDQIAASDRKIEQLELELQKYKEPAMDLDPSSTVLQHDSPTRVDPANPSNDPNIEVMTLDRDFTHCYKEEVQDPSQMSRRYRKKRPSFVTTTDGGKYQVDEYLQTIPLSVSTSKIAAVHYNTNDIQKTPTDEGLGKVIVDGDIYLKVQEGEETTAVNHKIVRIGARLYFREREAMFLD